MKLRDLTPAETLLLRNANTTALKDMLKYTLMDLLLKKVLTITETGRPANRREPVRVYRYITPTDHFKNYQAQWHESHFLSVFRKNKKLKLLLRNIVRIGFENASTEKRYYAGLIRNSKLKHCFSISLWQRIVGGCSYTDKGLQLKKAIQEEIEALEYQLKDLLMTNRERALEILKPIGGNVFLLSGLDFELAREIEKALMAEMSREREGGACSNSGCWVTFDDYSSTFDGHSPQHNSGDSGSGGWCSGISPESGNDSGSGCSGGCSGCGGCGGD